MGKRVFPPLRSTAGAIPDGRPRCKWAAGDALLADYHDQEWGRPIATDDGHLERMALEIFQCGLSWKIVLIKRPALRAAFSGFQIARVAAMTARDVNRLTENAAIIRNRRKIEATIKNAQRMAALAAQHGGYLNWLAAQPTGTPARHKALMKRLGETFAFMGPETSKCYLWGVGKVAAPHEPKCWMNASE